MKKAFIVVGGVLALVLVVVFGYITYMMVRYPDAGPPPTISVEATPQRLARGAYLVTHVAVCIDCHSTRDWTKFSGPVVPGTEGMGGFPFDESLGFPGTIYGANITPAGIGSLTDGEVLRAITSGVRKDNRPLFPLMPFKAFDQLSDDDLYSIIAYIRSLKPIPNVVPRSKLNFPVNILIRTLPAPHVSHPAPDTSNPVAYGKYLVNAANCINCHTQSVKGDLIKGMEFAGGGEFTLPAGTVRSANITPDGESGIGAWGEDVFIAKFKLWEHPDSSMLNLENQGFYSVMPWTLFSGMSERDLAAIYAYLRTVPPVRNTVTRWTPLNAAPPSMQ